MGAEAERDSVRVAAATKLPRAQCEGGKIGCGEIKNAGRGARRGGEKHMDILPNVPMSGWGGGGIEGGQGWLGAEPSDGFLDAFE